jgi:hypothetical protein
MRFLVVSCACVSTHVDPAGITHQDLRVTMEARNWVLRRSGQPGAGRPEGAGDGVRRQRQSGLGHRNFGRLWSGSQTRRCICRARFRRRNSRCHFAAWCPSMYRCLPFVMNVNPHRSHAHSRQVGACRQRK